MRLQIRHALPGGRAGKTRKAGALLAAAAVLTAAGCTAAPEPQAEALACSVEDALQAKVELAFNKGYKATGKYGLAQAAGEDGWLVAVEFTGGDADKSQAGVWFTRDTSASQVFSVDDAAAGASSWGLGEEDDPARRTSDSGYSTALKCLEERGETRSSPDT